MSGVACLEYFQDLVDFLLEVVQSCVDSAQLGALGGRQIAHSGASLPLCSAKVSESVCRFIGARRWTIEIEGRTWSLLFPLLGMPRTDAPEFRFGTRVARNDQAITGQELVIGRQIVTHRDLVDIDVQGL